MNLISLVFSFLKKGMDVGKKVAMISLGCSKNQVDSEVMLGFLKKAGHKIQENPEQAEVVIVNTCAFIKAAKEEALNTIFSLNQLKKKGKIKKIIVAGCLPERYRNELPELLKEGDGFLGPGSIDKIGEIINKTSDRDIVYRAKYKNFLNQASTPRVNLTPRHWAFVKIADGCNNYCSYCVIPQIRGKYRSRSITSITGEVKLLVQRGVREINLISQDTTSYGVDLYGKSKLNHLLCKLVKIKNLKWIRIMYAHPVHMNDALLKTIAAEPKICKYIDLPVQHISDKILKLMNRKQTGKQIIELITKIRAIIPEITLRSSLIVGFPQETETDFKQLYNFVNDVKFNHLGCFTYSQEEQTKAQRLKGQIKAKTKKQRYQKIMVLQQKIVNNKNNQLVGQVKEVLIDQILSKDLALGRMASDAPEVDGMVYIRGFKNKNLKPGDFQHVRIINSIVYDLVGEIL
ncbi:MAG: 30S ribosomal protein S12 methylthiotransferase RimO [Candidatus Omnitrophota bacterium]